MGGYVVVHAGSGTISEVYETEDQAQLARLEQIEEHLAEAVEHESADPTHTAYSLADIADRIREEWRTLLYVCEAE
ncbi:hypothetical protein [Pseudomonas sp. T8]|uniref:hypothetical protein n=1 Tax=Pseudomonas sp. T8 TaxID=645292 RepID=UPI002147AE81|nr:hypothetical protein [Pseudomonas sp. T8]UUT24109.1 hypothetical protein NRG23_09145 [Pseudomonas sp. T8]